MSDDDFEVHSMVTGSSPLRSAIHTTPQRLIPISSNSSTSSASSTRSSRMNFDNWMSTPGTPLTPPDVSKLAENGMMVDGGLEQSPSVRARRDSGRPKLSSAPITFTADNKVSSSRRASAEQMKHPVFKDLLPARAESETSTLDPTIQKTVQEFGQIARSSNSDARGHQKPAVIYISDDDSSIENSRTTTSSPRKQEARPRAKEIKVGDGDELLKFSRFRTKYRNTRFINEEIKKIMAKPKIPAKKPGWTYVLTIPDRAPNHFKIGNTMTMNAREVQWQKCESGFVLLEDGDMNGLEFHSIVESLVHQELQNARRITFCKRCGKDHDEWFEVSKEQAFECIGKWRAWITNQKPYQVYHHIDNKSRSGTTAIKSWKLTPYWQWKVDNLPKIIAHVDWAEWIQPSQLDYLDYWYEQHWGDQYLATRQHFKRKDKHFWLVGLSQYLIAHLFFGQACAIFTLIFLIIL